MTLLYYVVSRLFAHPFQMANKYSAARVHIFRQLCAKKKVKTKH